uniref:Uncharacterized protein n=1 Tax=Ananas comosus var. bracteatus TaxID=296719 RepID=A0A6V7Q952_ANACO|nr:unnamed protein product [Ananas comosus var. bracteatus]
MPLRVLFPLWTECWASSWSVLPVAPFPVSEALDAAPAPILSLDAAPAPVPSLDETLDAAPAPVPSLDEILNRVDVAHLPRRRPPPQPRARRPAAPCRHQPPPLPPSPPPSATTASRHANDAPKDARLQQLYIQHRGRLAGTGNGTITITIIHEMELYNEVVARYGGQKRLANLGCESAHWVNGDLLILDGNR